jgi:glucokinase
MSPARVIGVDAGGTKVLAGAVDEHLAVHRQARRTWAESGAAQPLDLVVEAIEEVRRASPEVEGIGIGVPSLVEWPAGISRWSNHLGLGDVDVRSELTQRLGLPVVVDNDANLAAIAEHRAGAAQGADHAVLVALGTGIGGALVIGGHLYRGAHGFAGELGHVVVDHDGVDCPGACPGRGCLEALASGRAIGVAAERRARAEPDSVLGRQLAEAGTVLGAVVTELAREGDPQARDVVADVGVRLGAGLTGLVNTFDPDLVVIGGGAVAAGDLLLEPARRVVAERALPPVAQATRIVPARFGEEAGMLGAALLAMGEDG